MAVEPAIATLLHIGVLAVAMAGGYLGLDRTNPENSYFAGQLDDAVKVTRNVLTKFSVREGEEVGAACECWQIHFLLSIAEMSVPRNAETAEQFARQIGKFRRRHAPFWTYFRTGRHLKLVASLFVLSSVYVIGLGASEMWQGWEGLISDEWVISILRGIYVFFAFVMIWVPMTVSYTYTLRRLGIACRTLESEIDQKMTAISSDVVKRGLLTSPVPGTPPNS